MNMKINLGPFIWERKGGSIGIMLGLLVLTVVGFYFFSCIMLYAIAQLTGWLEWSWMNGVYFALVLVLVFMIVERGK